MRGFPIKMAWYAVSRRNDYPGFEELVKTILKSPACDPQGIKNSIWYTPRDYRGNQFAICGQCVAAFMIPPGFRGSFQELAPPDDGSAYICDFNMVKPRCRSYIRKYDEAVAQNDLTILSDFLSWYSAFPDCPKNNLVKGRKWYGTADFTICELCYEDAVKGTSLASQLVCKIVPGEARCHRYSHRMRKLWLQACEENDLGLVRQACPPAHGGVFLHPITNKVNPFSGANAIPAAAYDVHDFYERSKHRKHSWCTRHGFKAQLGNSTLG